MNVREITARSILTKTGITGYDFCINPYVGCAHGCRYCYAGFMKRFTGHTEPWGEFVDVKTNAPEVLRRQLRRPRKGEVIIGTVTDPYQPLEERYAVTRQCLEALSGSGLRISILTRSPLCVRDVDLFRGIGDIVVGLTITTDREDVRALFEPNAPSIEARIRALDRLHGEGVATYAFVGPLMPMGDPEGLADRIAPHVDEVLIDRLNYTSKVRYLFHRSGLERFLDEAYFRAAAGALERRLAGLGVPVSLLF